MTKKVRTIKYYQNRTVTVPYEIKRIACGWAAQNSVIAMLGYGDRIIATTFVIKSVPLFSKFVPSITNAVYCFGATNANIEELIKARPDVLFIPDGSYGKFDQMSKMGIAVVPFESNSLRAIVERTVITGEILGPDAHERALKYQEYFNNNVARVQRVVSRIPKEKRVRVYHSIRNLLSTAGKNSLVQDWMDLAGAVNVAEKWFAGTNANTVSIEDIIASDPDVILVMNASAVDEIRNDAKWANVKAVTKSEPDYSTSLCRITTFFMSKEASYQGWRPLYRT
ncbi:MAG: ABC transporter substrate-binding protein [Geobacteraceae bacterium]|nr:ABC transporter substrate-binding protein [Geobacteraceae bacterium]